MSQISIDISDLRNIPKMLPLMRNVSKSQDRNCPAFQRALVTHCLYLRQDTLDSMGSRLEWFSPIESKGHMFFALSPMNLPHIGLAWYLDHMYCDEQNQGHGTRCLKLLCYIADYSRDTLVLHAQAEANKPLSSEQLKSWYEKFGFVFKEVQGKQVESWVAIRAPK